MEKLVGLPTDPNVVDPEALQNYYADIEVKSSLAINFLAFAKSRVAKKWATVGTKIRVNGGLTLGENIADAGGVVSSFEAWKKWESDTGKAKNLPGLHDFTHEQLIFLK
ncbi:hypothetical protein FOWG_18120 [Fusarium oxysporum f. sp. lycopersici MN25]|nr:hypothetical protein FOWG_18120 [Fusarium oxysporum f. sp. lycopersici MN25]